jgi:formylglycine-generating enzyme required for sulfatase activity
MKRSRCFFLVITFIAALINHAAGPSVGLNPTGNFVWSGAFQDGRITIEKSVDLGQSIWLPYVSVATGLSGSNAVPVTNTSVFYRAIATDNTTVPNEMTLVPSGQFQMGDNWNWDFSPTNEHPLHVVKLDSFFIDKYEVSFPKMRDIMQWAYDKGLIYVTNRNNNGLEIRNLEGPQHTLMFLSGYEYRSNFIAFANNQFSVLPGWEKYACTAMTWFGAAAYCNYKSDMEGLQRCFDLNTWNCDFSKNGYRLPTEAEFEKAARGGLTGNHFPWPSYGDYRFWNYISLTNANYTPTGQPHSFTPTPVGTYAPNGYGLYDVAGNMREWCFDWFSDGWYGDPASSLPNPHGPATGATRALRGGGFESEETHSRCAYRDSEDPDVAYWYMGFRAARNVP